MSFQTYTQSYPAHRFDVLIKPTALTKTSLLRPDAYLYVPAGTKQPVIRVARPDPSNSNSTRGIRQCYHRALRLAARKGFRRIGVSLLGWGIDGFSKSEIWEAAVKEISAFEQCYPDKEIGLFLPDRSAAVIDPVLLADLERRVGAAPKKKTLELRKKLERIGSASPAMLCLQDRRKEDEMAMVSTGPLPPVTDEMIEASRRKAGYTIQSNPASSLVFFDTIADADMPGEMDQMPLSDAPAPTGTTYGDGPLASADIQVIAKELQSYVKDTGETFADMLQPYLNDRLAAGVFKNKTEFYDYSSIDRRLYAKFAKKSYHPDKRTVLRAALALRMNRQETETLLGKTGYSLSPKITTDQIIMFFLDKLIFNIPIIDAALSQYQQPLL